MPELPDVEGFRRVLAQHAVDRPITRVEVLDPQVLRDTSPRQLTTALPGTDLAKPRRYGKWLMAPVHQPGHRHGKDDPTLVFHFGMTGSLIWNDAAGEPLHPHDRLVFAMEDGELRYRDMRKLQGVRLTGNDHDVEVLLSDLGPDAKDLSLAEFRDRLQGVRRQLKAALTDQSVLAGLGNLLTDEILWRAGLHPRHLTTDLSSSDVARLHEELHDVLRVSIRRGCVPPDDSWLTGWRDQPEAPCPRCGTPLRRMHLGGRATVWCPHCQPAP
ncbi:Fpg/Nei family DNA glycosylase [Actinopolymorpha alba]|uniref:Fpg/Nei family DNA glycosylase n=1 Tax=Actinopolymorpha alba TaxID=533267 RepID=UPI0003803BD4|nr:DNA-formamidopyrimidine glycosylase family protein [Actinopolymorpha alba]